MAMCQIKRGLTIFAFLLLSGMVLTLFGFTAYEAWTAHWLGGILSTLILVGVGAGIFFEGKAVFSAPQLLTCSGNPPWKCWQW